MENMKITTFEKGHVPTVANLSNPDFFTATAKQVQEHCTKNKLVHNIHGRKFPSVEAWQFAGTLMGLIPVVLSCENISTDNEIKYIATATLQSLDGSQVGGIATMICSNKESSKRSFAEYAICSMAQTRAIGKAYRLVLGWLFKAAGFEATPAEEMQDVAPSGPQKRSLEGLKALLNHCNTDNAIIDLWKSIDAALIPDGFQEACKERKDKINEVTKYEQPSSDGKATYTQSFSIAGGWNCTCPSTLKNCKHIKASKVLS
jgi:hypothetical protein